MGHGEPGNGAQIPKPITGVDIRSLPIGPMEAYVLSRVDGRASLSEIALSTGIPATEVAEHLKRLSELGAISHGEGTGPLSGVTVGRAPLVAGATSGTHPRVAPVIREAPPVAPPVAYDPKELDEPADLPDDRKRTILDTFYRLERLSHYELLNVPRDADKKAVKAAYFEVVGTFHPDKYYGKQLGPFKPKLERIFQRVTEAHDTLTRTKPREEYDRFLESQLATRALDEVADPSSALPEVDEIFREMEREARAAAHVGRPSPSPEASVSGERIAVVATNTPTQPLPRGNAPSLPPETMSSPPTERAAMTPEERRRALARKLAVGSTPPPSSKANPTTAKEAAGDALKRRFDQHMKRAKDERVARYVEQANQAIQAKNMVAATNALRIAVSLAPEDDELRERFETVEHQAAASLAGQYIEQAQYEERRGEFAAAATLYEKAIRGRPSAQLHERAAHSLLEARGDPKKASEYARKAVEMAPHVTAYRITLARVYARAGMEKSALGELERARTLDPSDDSLKDWVKRVKRGEV